jgi:hypothetical protein
MNDKRPIRVSMRAILMRVSVAAILLCGVSVCVAQVPSTAPSGGAGSAVVAHAAGSTGKSPSMLMAPGIDAVKQALATVKVDKWKAAGPVRDEASTNIASIQRDLDATLPGLLAAADGAPDSVSKVFPAYRNVDALYDVLLRVTTVGRLMAPSQESAALSQALVSLDDGRRALADRMQDGAVAAEKQVVDLRAQLKAVPPPVVAAAPVCPTTTTPAKKTTTKKPAAKPAAKPATPPATTPPSN